MITKIFDQDQKIENAISVPSDLSNYNIHFSVCAAVVVFELQFLNLTIREPITLTYLVKVRNSFPGQK
jgi:hypothetical protein